MLRRDFQRMLDVDTAFISKLLYNHHGIALWDNHPITDLHLTNFKFVRFVWTEVFEVGDSVSNKQYTLEFSKELILLFHTDLLDVCRRRPSLDFLNYSVNILFVKFCHKWITKQYMQLHCLTLCQICKKQIPLVLTAFAPPQLKLF